MTAPRYACEFGALDCGQPTLGPLEEPGFTVKLTVRYCAEHVAKYGEDVLRASVEQAARRFEQDRRVAQAGQGFPWLSLLRGSEKGK